MVNGEAGKRCVTVVILSLADGGLQGVGVPWTTGPVLAGSQADGTVMSMASSGLSAPGGAEGSMWEAEWRSEDIGPFPVEPRHAQWDKWSLERKHWAVVQQQDGQWKRQERARALESAKPGSGLDLITYSVCDKQNT